VSANLAAFLDAIAVSELGRDLIEKSDRGYDVLVGSTASAPHLFTSYADHPRMLVWLPRLKLGSTAAGRYQILGRIFDAYKQQLSLPDFSPSSQDRIAVQMIRERGALHAVETGDFEAAIRQCNNLWASLPGSSYGQHVNYLAALRDEYVAAGGSLAEV
jgi:muramidase (phage lysozyme)